jgi:hypothetical protein
MSEHWFTHSALQVHRPCMSDGRAGLNVCSSSTSTQQLQQQQHSRKTTHIKPTVSAAPAAGQAIAASGTKRAALPASMNFSFATSQAQHQSSTVGYVCLCRRDHSQTIPRCLHQCPAQEPPSASGECMFPVASLLQQEELVVSFLL